jgi:hypothetical protein
MFIVTFEVFARMNNVNIINCHLMYVYTHNCG